MNKVNFKASTRTVGGSNATPMSDEQYTAMSGGQQLLAKIGEALGVEVMIAEYEERYFVSRETITAIDSAIWVPVAVAAPAE